MTTDGKTSDKPTLLIVEDDEQLRQLMELVFSREYRVTGCGDGLVALDLFEKQPREIRLIIADLQMPGVGAVGLFERIKARGHTPPPFLVASGDSPANLAASFAGTPMRFLQKPFSVADLLAKAAELTDPAPRRD